MSQLEVHFKGKCIEIKDWLREVEGRKITVHLNLGLYRRQQITEGVGLE